MVDTAFTPWTSLAGGALIGLSAVLLMATVGRIAGISGILARLMPPSAQDDGAGRLAFVIGLIAAPATWIALSGSTIEQTVLPAGPVAVVAGLLVGFGAVWGSGCTSGHGVCGLARLSPRSMAAVGTFMATAVATVLLVRHVL
jgi:uncharacterized membrane protein YedE/YeeE